MSTESRIRAETRFFWVIEKFNSDLPTINIMTKIGNSLQVEK